jgi:hypothetical protein
MSGDPGGLLAAGHSMASCPARWSGRVIRAALADYGP